MAVKDAVTGSDPGAVLDVAEQGEEHAVAEYERAMEEEISICATSFNGSTPR
ncbi:MAG: hypothetical protein ACRDWA_13755 [Acidimicrobiia bacterium]